MLLFYFTPLYYMPLENKNYKYRTCGIVRYGVYFYILHLEYYIFFLL